MAAGAAKAPAAAHVLLKTKEPGGNFHVSMHGDSIVDLMNPFVGFYKMPTAAYYGGGYPSGEMKVIVKCHTSVIPITLPTNVHLELARSLKESPADTGNHDNDDDDDDDDEEKKSRGRGKGGRGGRGGGERGGRGGGRGGRGGGGRGAGAPGASTPAAVTAPTSSADTSGPAVATENKQVSGAGIASAPSPSTPVDTTPAPAKTATPSTAPSTTTVPSSSSGSSGKNPNGRAAALASIESKKCQICGEQKGKSAFTASQWKKDRSKCITCCQPAGQHSSTPTTAATDATESTSTTSESKETKASGPTLPPRAELSADEIKSFLSQSLSFDFFFIISDVTRELQNTRRKRNDVVNLVHHCWCFPDAPPGQRRGMNLPCGIFSVNGCESTAPRNEPNGGKGAIAYGRLTNQRISIHSDKRDPMAMCCSPNNARFFIDMKHDMTVFITVAHVPPPKASTGGAAATQPRAVVSLQWLLQRPNVALDRVIQSSRHVLELLDGLAKVMPSEPVAALVAILGQSSIDSARAADPTPAKK